MNIDNTSSESLDIENTDHISLEYDPERFDQLNKKLTSEDIDPVTHEIIRKSHASYYGYRTKTLNGGATFSYTNMYLPPKCYVARSRVHEHGVFAAMDIEPGETIEEMKTIILDTTNNTVNDWVLKRYGKLWECDCDICKLNGKTIYIPTGNGMLYNHLSDPNAYFQLEKPFRRLKAIALRKIKKDEEIFVYYGKEYLQIMDDVVKMYLRPDITEHGVDYKLDEYAKNTTTTTKSCGCKNKKQEQIKETNNIQSKEQPQNSIEFRSMIVPENKL